MYAPTPAAVKPKMTIQKNTPKDFVTGCVLMQVSYSCMYSNPPLQVHSKLPHVSLHLHSGHWQTFFSLHSSTSSQEFTPSPVKPGGHLQPVLLSSWENNHIHLDRTDQLKCLKQRVHELTTQAENVLPPRVSFQQPPLLISHCGAPEAVKFLTSQCV